MKFVLKCTDYHKFKLHEYTFLQLWAFIIVAWPLNESEAGDDLILIETSLLLFIHKFLLITAWEKYH